MKSGRVLVLASVCWACSTADSGGQDADASDSDSDAAVSTETDDTAYNPDLTPFVDTDGKPDVRPVETDVPDAPTWEVDVYPLFLDLCAPCHVGETEPSASLDLDRGPAGLVDVPSGQLLSMMLVAPGDLDRSYLAHKMRDTQLDVGGKGLGMPRGGGSRRITERDREIVERWIEQGAH